MDPNSLSSRSSFLSGISLLRHLCAQAPERPREPRFDGPPRATKNRRRLLFGEPQEVAAGDGQPGLLAQAADGVEQFFSALRRKSRRFGGRRAILRRTLPHGA